MSRLLLTILFTILVSCFMIIVINLWIAWTKRYYVSETVKEVVLRGDEYDRKNS